MVPKQLLIVDDEIEAMKKLVSLIDFEKLDFAICAILPDGKDAIEFLNKNQVDAVVTDIVMTFVGGLELCKYIQENYPDIYTIILSGYDDFKYAQNAVSLGVWRYLLKPVSLKEFTEALESVRDEINRKDKKKLLDVSIAYETVSLMKRHLYAEYLSGNISPEIFRQKIIEYEPDKADITSSPGVIAEIEMQSFHQFMTHSWNYTHDSFNAALERFVNMYDGVSAVLTNISDNKFEIILFHSNDISPDVALTKFVKAFKEITNIDTNIISKSPFAHFDSMAGYYLSDSMQSTRIITQRLTRLGNSLAGYVLSGDVATAQTTLNNIYVLLRSLSLYEAKYTALEILNPYREQISNAEQVIYGADDIDILIVNIRRLTDSLFKIDRTKHQDKLIEEAKQYINAHSTEDITLEMVADHVHLNHIYFSRLFKQITGKNYSDYLINLRMTEAIRLLKTSNLKIHEICLAVGYKNVKYFSENFKKNVGVLPSEYRRMMKK